MGSITNLLAELISFAITIYIIAIIARSIISWVNPNPYNPIVQALYKVTEPVLYPIRKALFRSIRNIGIDFSPLVAIMLLYIFRRILLEILIY